MYVYSNTHRYGTRGQPKIVIKNQQIIVENRVKISFLAEKLRPRQADCSPPFENSC